MKLGTKKNPLRVAIVGAGPTGFYTAEHLFKRKELTVEVDMFDRLPTPFGLVRGGVAPDHQKIKSVTKAFTRTAIRDDFRFYGNVEIGKDIKISQLRNYYHQIIYTTGAQSDRSLGIPGEDLQGSHSATEFVAWYNGHPDYRNCEFDLSQERVAVIGVGNVAMDVARILCRTPEALATTDIADYALEALSHSKVKEVYVLGRRGPAQAAFTPPEIKELGEMTDADITVPLDEANLDPLSQKMLEEAPSRATSKKMEIIQSYAGREATKSRQIILRFLVSPVELIGDETGRVTTMRVVKNKLEATETGYLRAQATNWYEDIDVGLVFRSVGYRGVPLPEVPFNDKRGTILNERGRVLDPDTREPIIGEYTAGWIKRGPSGVIGTNKPDALETVNCMMEDLEQGIHLNPREPNRCEAQAMIHQNQPSFVSYANWDYLDSLEVSRGQALGRPRLKFTRVEDMLQALAS